LKEKHPLSISFIEKSSNFHLFYNLVFKILIIMLKTSNIFLIVKNFSFISLSSMAFLIIDDSLTNYSHIML
jgi:hypothetical protein